MKTKHKKRLAQVFAIVMLFVMVMPAMAAGPSVKAEFLGNGSKAVLVVTVDGEQSEPLSWSNDSTVVQEVNGVVVTVAIKGNKVDKLGWEINADEEDVIADIAGFDAAMLEGQDLGGAVIFDDSDIGGGGKTQGLDEESQLPKVIVPANNASFHCNAHGGNGRVWIEKWNADWDAAVADAAKQGLKKAAVGLLFTQASDDAKSWVLNTTEYVCPCGRSDWISYSNKSGLPNGKNMQLQHLELDEAPTFSNIPLLSKTVDGFGIVDWAIENGYEDYIDMLDLFSQMKFFAHPVDHDGGAIPEGTGIEGELDINGQVTFPSLQPGWYAITEEFVVDSWAATNFATPKIQYFYVGENGFTQGTTINWDDPDVVAEFQKVYAVNATDFIVNSNVVQEAMLHVANVEQRANVDNAFGPPNQPSGASTNINGFTGLRFLENPEGSGITYYLGTDSTNFCDIYNHPDPLEPDLALVEVTFTDSWHDEAVDIYLVDAVIDGELIPGLTYAGRAFNRKAEGFGDGGFAFQRVRDVNLTFTNIFLPDNIEKASAIRLVDATTEVNEGANSSTYKPYDDGYDLDAIVAYYTLPPANTFKNVLEVSK